jgi:hypothetical protein
MNSGLEQARAIRQLLGLPHCKSWSATFAWNLEPAEGGKDSTETSESELKTQADPIDVLTSFFDNAALKQ